MRAVGIFEKGEKGEGMHNVIDQIIKGPSQRLHLPGQTSNSFSGYIGT